MFKNVASQKLSVFAWDTISNVAKTGDAANISAQISKDGGACAATNDVVPTELDATDAPGVYIFDMLQEETNANMIIVTAVSSTENIILRPVVIYTNRLASVGTNSGIALDLMVDRIYTRLFHEVNVTDADGTAAIRNAADDGNIATGAITDDDTTTSQAAWTWV